MVLSQEERNKFAAYLEENAKNNVLLEQQLDNIPGRGRSERTDAIKKRLRMEGMSSIIVAKMLRETEEG